MFSCKLDADHLTYLLAICLPSLANVFPDMFVRGGVMAPGTKYLALKHENWSLAPQNPVCAPKHTPTTIMHMQNGLAASYWAVRALYTTGCETFVSDCKSIIYINTP